MSGTPAEVSTKGIRSALFDLEAPVRDLRDGAWAVLIIAECGMGTGLTKHECKGVNFVAASLLAKAEAALEHLRAALGTEGDAQ